jgi:uncharacterized protein (UPF0548 family)
MMLRLRRPGDAELDVLLRRCANEAPTYAPLGISLIDDDHATLKRRRWTTALAGVDAFARAVATLQSWAMHRDAGLHVAADGPIAIGTNVAFSAPLPFGFVLGSCRIVDAVDEPNRYGFAYGTLPVHPERGEEAFLVTREESGTVRFDVVGVSRPAHPLARLAPPLADCLQDAAIRRYLAAMRTRAQ